MTAIRPTVGLSPWEVHPEDFPVDGGADQKLMFMLNFAILAPSCRNVQPWQFRLQGHEVELVADRSKSLRIIDPLDRELVISCGAALHHLRAAARYFCCDCHVELFPKPTEPNVLARISLGLGRERCAEDILVFEAIQRRRTNRFPFLPDPIPGELIAEFQRLVESEGAWLSVICDEGVRREVAELVAIADRQLWRDKSYRAEFAQWLRPNHGAARDGIPGYALGFGDLAAWSEPFLARTFDLGEQYAARDREIALQARALAVIGAEEDTPLGWLEAGQALSAMLLRACSEGLSASFLGQAVELPETRESLAAMTGSGGSPQVLLRLGFGCELQPTPRRPLAQSMLKSRHTAIRIS